MQPQQETPNGTTLRYISSIIELGEENLKKYGEIMSNLHKNKRTVNGKLTKDTSDLMNELMDKYMFLKQRAESAKKHIDLELDMKNSMSMRKLFFSERKKYKDITELKYALADELYWEVERLDNVILGAGAFFLQRYDPENAITMRKDPNFLDWLWLRLQVVLELLMLEKKENAVSSTTLEQLLKCYVGGYLYTDESNESYRRRFHDK